VARVPRPASGGRAGPRHRRDRRSRRPGQGFQRQAGVGARDRHALAAAQPRRRRGCRTGMRLYRLEHLQAPDYLLVPWYRAFHQENQLGRSRGRADPAPPPGGPRRDGAVGGRRSPGCAGQVHPDRRGRGPHRARVHTAGAPRAWVQRGRDGGGVPGRWWRSPSCCSPTWATPRRARSARRSVSTRCGTTSRSRSPPLPSQVITPLDAVGMPA
jgi:hypothetical protein